MEVDTSLGGVGREIGSAITYSERHDILLCLGIAAIAKWGHVNHCERPLPGAESGRPRASYEIRLDDLAALDPRRHGQTLGSQEFGVEETGLVPRSIVAKYGDDRVPRSHPPGQPGSEERRVGKGGGRQGRSR